MYYYIQLILTLYLIEYYYDMKNNLSLSFQTTIGVFSWYIAKVMGMVLLIPMGIIGLIVFSSITSGGTFSQLTPDIYFASGFIGLIFLLTYVVMGFLFPKGFVSKITITREGISQTSLSSTKNVSRAAIIGGIITKSPGAIGAGILAEAGDNRIISWKEIKQVTVYHQSRYMYFSRGRFSLYPIGFFCPQKYFNPVLEALSQYNVAFVMQP